MNVNRPSLKSLDIEYGSMKRYATLLLLILLTTGIVQGQPSETETDSRPGLTPDNPFYGVEKIVENIEVKMAGVIGGPELKAKAMANNADERLAEASAMAEKNKTDKASELVDRYSKGINRSQDIASRSSKKEVSKAIGNLSERNIDKLEKVREKVPENAKTSIDKAINKSKERKNVPGNRPEIGEKGPERNETNSPVEENDPRESAETDSEKPKNISENLSDKSSKEADNPTPGQTLDKNGSNSEDDRAVDENPVDRDVSNLP